MQQGSSPEPASGALVAEWFGPHVLISAGESAVDGAARERQFLGGLPATTGQLFVIASQRAYQPALRTDLAAVLRPVLAERPAGLQAVWLAVDDLAADSASLAALSAEFDIDVLAPDGPLTVLSGSGVYVGVSTGGSGWQRFRSDVPAWPFSTRYPVPSWEAALPGRAVSAAGTVAEPVLAGVLLRAAEARSVEVLDPAFRVALDVRQPKAVIGGTGPVPPAESVAALLNRLPAGIRTRLVLVPAAPDAARHPWLIELVTRLGRPVVLATGAQYASATGVVTTVALTPAGAHHYRPFATLIRQLPDGSQEVLDAASAPAGWVRRGEHSYRPSDELADDLPDGTVEGVTADVVPSGLVLRASTTDPVAAAPLVAFDPECWTVYLGAPGETVGAALLTAAELLLRRLGARQLAAARVRVVGRWDGRDRSVLDRIVGNLGVPVRMPKGGARPAEPRAAPASTPVRLAAVPQAMPMPHPVAAAPFPAQVVAARAMPQAGEPTSRPTPPPPRLVVPTTPGIITQVLTSLTPAQPPVVQPPVVQAAAVQPPPPAPIAPPVPSVVAPLPVAGPSGVALPDRRPPAGRSPDRPLPKLPPPSTMPSAAPATAAGARPSASPIVTISAAPVSTVSGAPARSDARPEAGSAPAEPMTPPQAAPPPAAGAIPTAPPPSVRPVLVQQPYGAPRPEPVNLSAPPAPMPSAPMPPAPMSPAPMSGAPVSGAPMVGAPRPAAPVPVAPIAAEHSIRPELAARPRPAPEAAQSPVEQYGSAAAVPERTSTAAEQNRFAAAAGEVFGEALATVNAALATWPALRQGEDSSRAKSDYVAICLYFGRGDGSATALNDAVRRGRPGVLDGHLPCLVSGIRRLPTHRRAVLRQGAVSEPMGGDATVGRLWTEPGFLSAAMNLDITVPGAELDVLIWPATARRTSELMMGRPVDEAVFAAGSRFKALAVRAAPDDHVDDPDLDPDAPTAPRLAVLIRELAPGETATPSPELDERDLAALAKLDRALNQRRRSPIRVLDEADAVTRLTTAMIEYRGESASGQPVLAAAGR